MTLFHGSNLLENLDRIQNELARAFEGPYSRTGRYPAINLYANDDAYLVTAELPGVAADDIKISVTGDVVSISGKRDSQEVSEDATLHRRERFNGEFNRRIELPKEVDGDKVEATMKNGVLSITLPVKEEVKPRTIAVKQN